MNRIKLRRFIEEDFSDVYEMESDVEIMRFTGPGKAQTREESLKRFSKLLLPPASSHSGYWAIEDKSLIVGWLMLINNEKITGEYEIGFMIKKNHWNRGYASEAVDYILNVFGKLEEVVQIVATVDVENFASIRIFKQRNFDERKTKNLIYFTKRML